MSKFDMPLSNSMCLVSTICFLKSFFSQFSQSKIMWNSRYCGSLLPVFGVSVTFHLTCVHIILIGLGC